MKRLKQDDNGRVIETSEVEKGIATKDEIAKAVIFLTSEQALKITGHIMRVDGGRALTSKGHKVYYGA